LVWGKFVNAGQTCIAPDYLLVQKSVKKELIFNLKKLKLSRLTEKILKESTDYPRIVNTKNF